jgi:hypothetical protein
MGDFPAYRLTTVTMRARGGPELLGIVSKDTRNPGQGGNTVPDRGAMVLIATKECLSEVQL